ncbi:MAG: response regulator, partial [Candidatus Aminicenantes bacterium]|nr:response regulator [Candidatus Aminicenantes bacterium]NIM83129.1 response regulator [Candidatus Aminicenantes bacterium]NIN22509.1 response regulator [Candidatus Aminicenantes bacterium]NIN46277.1 response regulator [Candidatus Aminicenantes bacterium]NIN89115.1 response regulator [Candidatus Aminicenantes bacterium]
IFDKTYGLQDDKVHYVFEDIRGNLWLCLDRGITKIEYTSSISLYDDRSGLSGSVSSVVRHHNYLYVGTTKGLYCLEAPFKFRLISGISGSCWHLLSVDDSILAATDYGVFQVDTKNNTNRRVINESSYLLLPSKHHPGRVWCGRNRGLSALIERNGQWIEKHRFEKDDQDIRFIAEDKKGDLWLVTSTGGVIKVDFRPDINHPVVTGYDTSHGLPDGGVDSIGVAAGHVIFATKNGIFRFNEEEKKFVPDETLGKEFAGGRPDSKPVFRLIEDKNKHIWFTSESRNFQAIPGPGGPFRIYSEPFRRIPTTNQVNVIYPDPGGKTIWFGGSDGLFRYDTTIKKSNRKNFATLLRRVRANEQLIFDGFKTKTGKTAKDLFPIFEYRDRNLYFEFAATFFEAENETHYQCFMKGYDKDWSSWSKDTKRNYTNLDSGLYTFRVRAKNVYEHMGEENTFRFKVLPPWYKTWWALLFYAILFFLLVFFIVRWRSGKLEREKQRLEQIVKERTKEINEKNQQLEKQTIKLTEQSEKLKEMDKVKSRFFANISHEFRTPLTLIMSPLEQMFDDTRDEKQKKELNMMLRNSRRLLTLINQLLDLSRIDSGKMKLQTACQNIVPFLKGILASFHGLARQNKLELDFHPEEEDISVYFDAQKLEEVMYNLLINAVKFTPPGGKITVSVSIDRQDQPEEGSLPPGFVKISVCDTGIGIPKDQLSQIFDRFFQAKISKEKAHKGTGIGLALTKEIVLLHRGKIDVHSQLGKGTEFVILLPLEPKQPEPGEIAATSETSKSLKKRKEADRLYMIEEEDEPTAVETKTDTEPGIRVEGQEKNIILVVEDNADVRKYIRGPLEQFYTVVEAEDGKEGIDKAKEIIPDLIVSDIMMPEVDGYELCKELKKDVKTSHIPTILLTAKASEESIIQGLETGADDYVTKPFNTKILLSRIKNLIDLRRQLQLKIQRQKMLLPHEISVSSVDEKFLKELQDIIEKNLSDEDFSVDMLCEKLHMGRSTLFRKIQALAGETPSQFIHSYRLERAAQLLRENFGNVTEVAMEVGFSSPQYFAKLFKEKFHRSPSSFKASEASEQ